MTVRIRPSSRPSRTVRYLHLAMAALNFALAAMLIYLRLGPFARVLQRFEERGVEIPAWFSAVFNVGVLVLAGFLLVRGVVSFRRAQAARGAGG